MPTPSEPGQSAPFTARISKFLRHLEYRRCDRDDDLELICRLRYKAYAANLLVPEEESQSISDELDRTKNSFTFGVFHDGTLISTLRVHHVTGETPSGPSMLVYDDLLLPRLRRGEHFIDPSRFAADPEWTRNAPEIPFVTLRLAVMACIHFDAPFCLSTIRPEHSAFYRRIFQSKQIGPLRHYPQFTRPVALYEADVNTIQAMTFSRFPFFRSAADERKLLFASRVNAVLPSFPGEAA